MAPPVDRLLTTRGEDVTLLPRLRALKSSWYFRARDSLLGTDVESRLTTKLAVSGAIRVRESRLVLV